MNNLGELIAQKESIARRLEPGKEERRSLRNKVINITEEFLEDLAGMNAYVGPNKYSIEHLTGDFPEAADQDQVLGEIKESVDIPGINPASGNHLGYIPGGGLYASALGDYWADVTNRYSGIYFADPGAVKIENELIRWMIELVGYPKEAWGNLASGGSIANLTAIIAAREALSITPDKISRAVIYLTGQTHHCVTKALKIAGLHHAKLRRVPMDNHLKMDPLAFEEYVKKDIEEDNIPFMVVTSAGTTDAGVIDPFEDIDGIAKNHKIWHHIDAAYGGFFLLASFSSSKLKAINVSDSLVMDPHKSLFLPYGLGVVLVKDRRHLLEAYSYDAHYMQDALEDDAEISPAEVSPELTKHFRGLRMWLPLKLYGLEPFKAGLEEKHYLAKYFCQELLKLKGFEVFMEPELSVVMFRYNAPGKDLNGFNRRLVKEIHDNGRIFISSTTVEGIFWLRVAILVFRTHKDTIDLTIGILKEITSRLKEKG